MTNNPNNFDVRIGHLMQDAALSFSAPALTEDELLKRIDQRPVAVVRSNSRATTNRYRGFAAAAALLLVAGGVAAVVANRDSSTNPPTDLADGATTTTTAQRGSTTTAQLSRVDFTKPEAVAAGGFTPTSHYVAVSIDGSECVTSLVETESGAVVREVDRREAFNDGEGTTPYFTPNVQAGVVTPDGTTYYVVEARELSAVIPGRRSLARVTPDGHREVVEKYGTSIALTAGGTRAFISVVPPDVSGRGYVYQDIKLLDLATGESIIVFRNKIETDVPPELQSPSPSNGMLDVAPETTIPTNTTSDTELVPTTLASAPGDANKDYGYKYYTAGTTYSIEGFDAKTSTLLLTIQRDDGAELTAVHIDGTEHADDSQIMYSNFLGFYGTIVRANANETITVQGRSQFMSVDSSHIPDDPNDSVIQVEMDVRTGEFNPATVENVGPPFASSTPSGDISDLPIDYGRMDRAFDISFTIDSHGFETTPTTITMHSGDGTVTPIPFKGAGTLWWASW